MKLRQTLIISVGFLIGVMALLLATSLAHGQVAITAPGGIPPFGTPGGASCYPTFASTGASNPAPITVWPDMNDYAITGSYSVNLPDCNQGTNNSSPAVYNLCVAFTNAFQSAMQIANGNPGFPQGAIGGTSNNEISLELAGNVCTNEGSGRNAWLCANPFDNPGEGGIHTTIYLDADSPELSNSVVNGFENNPTYATCVVAHEMSHAFGVADVPGYSGNGLMGRECNPSMTPSSEATAGNPWDPGTAATIRALNSNSSLSINPTDCTITCPEGQYQRFHQNSSGIYVPFCSNSPSTSADTYTCNCTGSNPTCTDDETQQVSPATTAQCPAPDPSSLTCQCNSSQSDCTSSNTQSLTTTFYPPPAGVCSSVAVPPGEVCTCAFGVASCQDTNGNSVAVPSNFSCSADGGYDCESDGSCVYEASGGQYLTMDGCQTACGQNSDVNAYSCIENTCQYVGSGFGTYSDPTCEDECGY